MAATSPRRKSQPGRYRRSRGVSKNDYRSTVTAGCAHRGEYSCHHRCSVEHDSKCLLSRQWLTPDSVVRSSDTRAGCLIVRVEVVGEDEELVDEGFEVVVLIDGCVGEAG